MNTDNFENLSLGKPLLRSLKKEGYETPTPIQQTAIPEILAGRDILATAQTGTGKTAAFALPILELLHHSLEQPRKIRALVLTPTRELALQVDESFRTYGQYLPLRSTVILGGVSIGAQIKALRRFPDILVATPGRLLDLLNRREVRLDHVEMLVLDEADRMLDMGFIHDVRRIVSKLSPKRQTAFFSATLTGDIARFAAGMLRNPSHLKTAPPATVAGNISQKVLFVERSDKIELLSSVLKDEGTGRTLVFTRTKHQADKVMRQLWSRGISADSIHSDKNQRLRQRALSAFDRGKIKVLVATDIVARGIDVEGISHVVNFELPNDPESYVHRIGRTARAGAAGIALSFCDFQEVSMLRAIEKLTKSSLTAVDDHPYHSQSLGAMCMGKSSSTSRRGKGRGSMARRRPRKR
jgi:ATP-dependent RNA helicase RhlE